MMNDSNDRQELLDLIEFLNSPRREVIEVIMLFALYLEHTCTSSTGDLPCQKCILGGASHRYKRRLLVL